MAFTHELHKLEEENTSACGNSSVEKADSQITGAKTDFIISDMGAAFTIVMGTK